MFGLQQNSKNYRQHLIWLLSLLHFITAINWLFIAKAYNFIGLDVYSVCYSWFNSCSSVRFFSAEVYRWILVGYAIFSIVILFQRKEKVLFATLFWALFIFKFLIYIQDYRLMSVFDIAHLFLVMFYLPNRATNLFRFFKVSLCLLLSVLLISYFYSVQFNLDSQNCKNTFIFERSLNEENVFQFDTQNLSNHLKCDPVFYKQLASNFCGEEKRLFDVKNITLFLSGQSRHNQSFVKKYENACTMKIDTFSSQSDSVANVMSKFSDLSENAEQISIYRGNNQRTGQYFAEHPHAVLRKFWSSGVLNDNIHSASKSSPITDGKNIYVGNDRGQMISFDEEGKMQWRVTSNSDRGVHGTAVIAGNAIFWGDYSGMLLAANKDNGHIMWTVDLADTIGSTPLYSNKYLYVSVETHIPSDGFVAKVDASSGNIIWKSPMLGEQAHSSPAMSEDGKTIYVGSNNGFMSAIDTNSGEFRWRYRTEAPIKGTAAVAKNDVYFCSWDKNLYKLNSEGKLIWKYDLNGSCQSSVTFSNNFESVFVLTKTGMIISLDTGNANLKWSYQAGSPLISSAVNVINSQKQEILVTVCGKNKICFMRPESGQIISTIITDSLVTSVPLVLNKYLYASQDSEGGLRQWK